jgi:hypothetical protein
MGGQSLCKKVKYQIFGDGVFNFDFTYVNAREKMKKKSMIIILKRGICYLEEPPLHKPALQGMN